MYKYARGDIFSPRRIGEVIQYHILEPEVEAREKGYSCVRKRRLGKSERYGYAKIIFMSESELEAMIYLRNKYD